MEIPSGKRYDGEHFSIGSLMATVQEIVSRQKEGAQFVISAQMLRLGPEEFETLVNIWLKDGDMDFELAGVPHRALVDGEFFIDRITVIKSSRPK
jgi:hypothetical protein